MLHERDSKEGIFGEKKMEELAQLMDRHDVRDNFERRALGCVCIKVVKVFTQGKVNDREINEINLCFSLCYLRNFSSLQKPSINPCFKCSLNVLEVRLLGSNKIGAAIEKTWDCNARASTGLSQCRKIRLLRRCINKRPAKPTGLPLLAPLLYS